MHPPGEVQIRLFHKLSPANIHFWLSAALIVALVPSLRHLHIPLRFDWTGLAVAYWLVLSAQSIFLATLLYLAGSPWRDSLGPFMGRYKAHPAQALVLLFYLVILAWALGWLKGLILCVDTIAFLELRQRLDPRGGLRPAFAVLMPGLYLFIGFLLVFSYNDIILSLRFYGSTDANLNSADKWLLFGKTVSDLCHGALRVFPMAFFRFLEFIYFGMFPQVGAGILFSSLRYGKKRGLQFVGAVLTGYYIALLLFYLWPSQGPYYLCPGHFSRFPSGLAAYAIQKQSLLNAQALWQHVPIRLISKDYYIAFPCMHIVQPLIVIWFLRAWKRIVIVLAAYDVLLVAAILLLEWHYVSDILAGVLVAACAVAIADGPEVRRWIADRGSTKRNSNPSPVTP